MADFSSKEPEDGSISFSSASLLPQSLQTNRLFSSEFFSMARGKMNPNGILAFTLPGSLTYLSPALKDLNGCILGTLKNAYRHVRVIPGEVNLYLASDSDILENLYSNEISKRFEDRKIKASLITRNYIEYRLNERWVKWFQQSMGGRKIQINSDFHPLAVFFNLSYWNSLFSLISPKSLNGTKDPALPYPSRKSF